MNNPEKRPTDNEARTPTKLPLGDNAHLRSKGDLSLNSPKSLPEENPSELDQTDIPNLKPAQIPTAVFYTYPAFSTLLTAMVVNSVEGSTKAAEIGVPTAAGAISLLGLHAIQAFVNFFEKEG